MESKDVSSDESEIKFYTVCADIYRFLVECKRKGSNGGELWIFEDNFEVFKKAQKTCNITLIDLGETGKTCGLVKSKIRKVVITRAPITPEKRE